MNNIFEWTWHERVVDNFLSCTVSCKVRKTMDMFNQISYFRNQRCNTAVSDGLIFVASLKTVVRLVFIILMSISKDI